MAHKSGAEKSELIKPGLATRVAATKLLSAIIDKKTSMDGLLDSKGGNPSYLVLSQQDRLLVKAILLSTLRNYGIIDAFIDKLLESPLPGGAVSLRHILRVGAAQILFLDIPDHSAVDLSVEQANADPRNRRFANLTNAILRRMSREKKKRMPGLIHKSINLPTWFYDRLVTSYGEEQAQDIAKTISTPAPVDITVKSDAQGWAERLGGKALTDSSVRLETISGAIPSLDGFEDGEWWVQDVAASLPAKLFGDLTGKRVIDLCAAPGGKTAQLIMAGGRVTALDRSKNRLNRLNENLSRLKLSADLKLGKMEAFETDDLYDAALLDAPCSSTGTIRRHPDVVWTKSEEDIGFLANLQFKLLEHSLTLVKPGGQIIFSNCSMELDEGEKMLEAFLEKNSDKVKLEKIDANLCPGFEEAIASSGILRTTPNFKIGDEKGVDGFFAASLRVI
ncbi:RsmB/NOP family class I SAM-dependent RNA methyltransferase [Lentilitoribacter sp. EG35]|uniref:RsmB/NOP family class I SAM-dependent RNA methyltransferase n=1 Tax=Lentilitoribacter sp. EG35 TaxID=3234192 RepID=UPI00345FE811